ncbi:HyfG [Desulforapulum autotrophicum HRM2]|uniref:HyfG n=1 Tax=Desulforapulum autotrophicum (strain ATCC 43914 / DSM 3382 / VKM B-1955 / HRM2) TaxID=177437 RepID=C0QBF7_DESAH|nr:NADH-quinone oxidoreductase subunit C [Desulforapulum autotrophicum]ACN16959.1 HyfG [Desulforapulum autotrophicum HRM2]
MGNSPKKSLTLSDWTAIDYNDCPVVSMADFRTTILDDVRNNYRICSFFGTPNPEEKIRLICVLANDDAGSVEVVAADTDPAFQSLTPDCPQVQAFEREIYEQWNVLPQGHPWLKSVRSHPPVVAAHGKAAHAGTTDFFSIDGEEAHEVAVGPVHAGIIEPGHFRFQCHGETVYHLEISLGYQHRGVEPALKDGPDKRTLHYFETLAGDTSIGHGTAGCCMIEALAGIDVPPRGQAIRAIAAELERIANHIGDLGAISGDVGFLPTMSYCGRIRGDALNLTAMICGNRFGRGLVIPGGTAWDITHAQTGELLRRLDEIHADAHSAIELMLNTPSVLARLENTGQVPTQTAREIGLVGLAARASGLKQDVRTSHPYENYRLTPLPVITRKTGDCLARAQIRWGEIQASFKFIRTLLADLPGGEVANLWEGKLPPQKMATILVEGWRGEICHTAATDSAGKFSFYKIVDPSFHNWFGVSLALRNQQISDFPLCNKSFNLSYCGHDL